MRLSWCPNRLPRYLKKSAHESAQFEAIFLLSRSPTAARRKTGTLPRGQS